MKRVGIGGFQLADVDFGSGQTVERKILFGSAEWLEAVRHAAAEADRLGLEMALFSSPGWSMTGGPWVKPEQAMKKLVWSETVSRGAAPLHGSTAAAALEQRSDPGSGDRRPAHWRGRLRHPTPLTTATAPSLPSALRRMKPA